jgi:UDP-N-acetylmuramoyl-L-alanyl-D-glutamate--2,6-diaminopimelate ligase
MQLGDLFEHLSLDIATSSIEITRVDIDSRECELGSLFFALPGANVNGINFVDDAVKRGAVCIVADRPLKIKTPAIVVATSHLHSLVALASALIVGNPESRAKLVGVTGTNGKTSVTTMLASLARSLSWNASSIGTLTNQRTTPAAPELFRSLAHAVDSFDGSNPHSMISMEVSSHALDQHRIDGLRFCVAAFTNLGHDHLDYHSSMEKYFEAKASLFTTEYAKRAVIWVDDEYGERLATTTNLPVTRVSRSDATEVSVSFSGSTFFWRDHLVNSPLIGGYNVDNALLAMSIMSCLGVADGLIAQAMGQVVSIPGRFEVLRGDNITAIVDYAHTPEGLARLLSDVRLMQPGGKIITVFGAGGDRDKEKRPEMGRVVSSQSDVTIVTSDNPRFEQPDAIIDAVMSGVVAGADVIRYVDRREAIHQAFARAGVGDVVVLAGKGHETTQVVRGQSSPFDDREIAKELLT